MRKLFLCLLTGLSLSAALAVPVQVDLTTGATSGSPLPVGSNDDTWTVQLPNLTVTNAIVSNGTLWSGTTAYPNAWAEDHCGQWISPWTITTTGATFGMVPGSLIPIPPGLYRYRMSFYVPCITPGGASITLNRAGADNSLTQVVVNGNIHPVTASFGTLSTISIALGAAEVTTGMNTIEMVVNNFESYTGLFICGTLRYEAPDPPRIRFSADDKLCSGDQVTATAVTTSGSVLNHSWNLFESDMNGNYIPGGYNWSSPLYLGAPNYSYIFPGGSTLPCNRYYTIRLITTNACQSTLHEIVIYIACNNPAFSLSNNTSNPSYYTMSATPNDLAPYGPVGGFGYAWFVEELDAFGNPIYTISNPAIWWTFTANYVGYVNNFRGFDGSTPYPSVVTVLPTVPPVGRFLYNRTYRITRGTWVKEYCDWKQFSQTITVSMKQSPDGSEESEVTINDNVTAPDMSELYRQGGLSIALEDKIGEMKLYPNPAVNEISIDFRSSHSYEADYVIQDISGRAVVKGSFKVNEGQNHQNIPVDQLGEGMYLLRVNGMTEVKKLTIQR